MKRIFFLIIFLAPFLLGGCNEDESGTSPSPSDKRTGRMNLDVTGRVGTVIGAKLTDYVKSLDLLLFRKNDGGEYVLEKSVQMNKAVLLALSEIQQNPVAGFTQEKEVEFDSLLLGTYQIVGIGNIRDSLGNVVSSAVLNGVTPGNTMAEVIASIVNNSPSPRLFYGVTAPITVGESAVTPITLELYRKVSMFLLTVKELPDALNQIDLFVNNTYGAFNMTGAFLSSNIITVTNRVTIPATQRDSIVIGVVTLPTESGKSSAFSLDFKFSDSQVVTVDIPSYVLKENTITKLTATIDASQTGGRWTLDLLIGISANVEWNVDQEPPIII